MQLQPITAKQQQAFDGVATHPLQTYAWGTFREKTGIKVLRYGLFTHNKLSKSFQLTIHPIPHSSYTIGYLPKGYLPDETLLSYLYAIGKKEKCIFIQLEPNIPIHDGSEQIATLMQQTHFSFVPSARPLFTKYTFQLDLTKSEDELLQNMHPKTRYNIKVARKHGVTITEDNSPEGFDIYWNLMEETTKRQHFYAHTKQYHQSMWNTLRESSSPSLGAHLLIAYYTPPEQKKRIPLAAWILFTFHHILYYPYGSSSSVYRNVMASNLMMWEAIILGKEKGMQLFDMWGSLGNNPNTNDPWYGFHRLKQGYGPTLVEFVGSYDLVIHPVVYQFYKAANRIRQFYLRSS